MKESNVILFQDVVKTRENIQIGPLNIQIPQGCVTAIVGTNGSGKTTLLSMCMGFVHPDRGVISIFQEQIQSDRDAALKARIGFVGEHPNSDDNDWTADQLAAFTAQWYPKWDWQFYQHHVTKYGIPPKKKLHKLSKGIRRKLDLIIAMSPQPELLLLDEPSSGLDPLAWRMMIDDMHTYLQDGKRSVVIATHSIEEVKRLADYILFMYKGQVLQMVEKDAMFDAWKEFFIDGKADDYDRVPGLVKAIQERYGVRLISNNAEKLEAFLQKNEIPALQTKSMELDDILAYLIELNDEGRNIQR